MRERVGYGLLDLLKADYFASYVWDEVANRFDGRVTLNMNDDTLQSYEAYYQFHDPITFELQARRVPTLVTQVMPQRAHVFCSSTVRAAKAIVFALPVQARLQ